MLTVLVVFITFYLAWNLGANDVANAMGTSVGSKAISLRQALIIAGVLEFTGAVLFGHEVSQTLATEVANPNLFADAPQILVAGMVSVLLSCALWLQIATSQGIPVSSSHAVVGAIAGFSAVAVGLSAIDWSTLGMITLGWIITPIISGAIAALFYSQIKRWILKQEQQLIQLSEWIPWLSVVLLGVFGVIVLPPATQPLANYLITEVGIKIPSHDIPLLIGTTAAVGLTFYSWRVMEDGPRETTKHSRMATERIFARFQLLSACFVAFAHGSNDVGNAIAPLAAIAYINRTGNVPLNDLNIPKWILVVGAAGIVAGLAVYGKKVIATIGESIITLQPSSGFCAELATATTVILATRLGLPVSTSQALVGGVVGIGVIQNVKSVQFQTLPRIAAAWLITLPVSAILSAMIFAIIRYLW